MIDPNSKSFPSSLSYRLFTSKAFIDLKPASRMILILLYFEADLDVNVDDISLPYKEIRDRIGYTDKTIWTSINDILAHGFMELNSDDSRFNTFSKSNGWEGWKVGDIIYKRGVDGYVYIIKKSSGIVKIGISKKPKTRILNLENMNGERFIKTWISNKIYNSNIVEKKMHSKFKDKRILGEWFDITHKSAVEFCKKIINTY